MNIDAGLYKIMADIRLCTPVGFSGDRMLRHLEFPKSLLSSVSRPASTIAGAGCVQIAGGKCFAAAKQLSGNYGRP